MFYDYTTERPTVLMVNPPLGRKYGFPKVFTGEVGETVSWLVANGYPQHLVDAHGDKFYITMWEETLTSLVPEGEINA